MGSSLSKAAAVLVLAAFSAPPCAAASGTHVAFATAGPSGSLRRGVLGARTLPAALCAGRASRTGKTPLFASSSKPGEATVRPGGATAAGRGGRVPAGLTLAPALWVEGGRLFCDGDVPKRGEVLAEV